MALLNVEAVDIYYRAVRATSGVSFSIDENEIVALIGANGAGKSSLLKAIIGLVPLKSGRILLDGQTISGMLPYEVVRRGIGLSPEGRRVFAESSVMENLMSGAHTLPGRSIDARLEQIFAYIPLLKERHRQAAGSLSGGEQQMLAIGRALMAQPRVLLLDEPSLGLAPIITERVGDLIREIQSTERISVLLAEQNSTWALRLAGRGIVIELGSVTLRGTSEALFNDPHVREAYLGV